jgi:hypothetical protein
MGTITSANSQFIISVPGVSSARQVVQGYAADDAFTQDAFDMAETRMGVDAILSAGYTPAAKPLNIMLQPDSPSLAFFFAWKAAEESAKEKFEATVTIYLPSIGLKFTLSTGWLRNMQGMPSAKKVLEPVPIKLEFQDIVYSPI